MKNIKLEKQNFDSFIDDKFTYDHMQNIISDAVKNIQASKEKLIFDRICQMVQTDTPIDLTKECQKLFPRIRMIFDERDRSENYYWNDGTDEGLHLISFFPDELGMQNPEPLKYTIGFKYR